MTRILYGKAVYDNKEVNASIKVLKNKSLSLIDGPSVKDLERKIRDVLISYVCIDLNSQI